MRRRIAQSAVVVALSGAAAFATPNYTAIILGSASGDSAASAIAGGQEVGYFQGGATPGYAALWTGSAASVMNLNPPGYNNSEINATNGLTQGGWGQMTPNGSTHALLWSGTASSAVDLTPAGYSYAVVNTIAGQWQGGAASPTDLTTQHAALWQGTAGSFQDLNPSGFDSSQILAMTTTQQVGQATFNVDEGPPNPPQPITHAILWNGSANSYVDLNPSSATDSSANAIYGEYQGGQAGGHATIWNGTAASAVDLNPLGIFGSTIFGMSNNYEVGYTSILTQPEHAALWEGSASTWIDLQQYLPSQFAGSAAFGVDQQGDVVGWAADPSQNLFYAVLWLVPEPTTIAIVGIVLLMPLSRRRRSLSSQ